MTFGEITVKAARKSRKLIYEKLEEYYFLLLGSELTDRQFKTIIKSDANIWLRQFRDNLLEKSIFPRELLSQRMIKASEREQILESADVATRHEFDLLGSGRVKVDYFLKALGVEGHHYDMQAGREKHILQLNKIRQSYAGCAEIQYDPIDWHVDFKSGYRWKNNIWFNKIRIGQGGVDVKVPWELSRFQHGIRLGQAYRMTSDEHYAQEMLAQIIDWIHANPMGFGVNWLCPMDVAIRGSNWLVSLSLIHDSENLKNETLWLIAKSLYQHAWFIRNHLEWSPTLTSNHYTSDISGLYIISVFMNHTSVFRDWEQFSVAELEKEIQKQVYQDGCNFEASTCYHRLVLELFFYPALVARKSGEDFSEVYLNKIDAMFQVIETLMHGNGYMPQFGDNDSGRLFIPNHPDTTDLDMGYLLPVAKWFFNKDMPQIDREQDFCLLFWLSGQPKIKNSGVKYRSDLIKLYPNAGWAVLANKKFHVAISCGSNGQNGNGGHAHNDKMSFELSLDGKLIIVDPGTYLYTPSIDKRNLFRSTAMHSTPQSGIAEQNSFIQGRIGAFVLPDKAHGALSISGKNQIKAEHQGFASPLNMIMTLTDNRIVCQYTGIDKNYTMRWMLHPDVRAEILSSGVLLENRGSRLLLSSASNCFSVSEYQYSSAYGTISKSLHLQHQFHHEFDWKLEELES